MAAVTFPDPAANNPATGAPYGDGWYNPANGVTYKFENNVWSAITEPNTSLDARYVEVAGDNMTGALTLGPNGGPAVTTLAADGSATLGAASNATVSLGYSAGTTAQLVVAGTSSAAGSPPVLTVQSAGVGGGGATDYVQSTSPLRVGENALQPTITLNTDGTASFAGAVFSDGGYVRQYDSTASVTNSYINYDENGTSNFVLKTDGEIMLGGTNLTSSSPVPNVSLKADGSATFAGGVQADNIAATSLSTNGSGTYWLRCFTTAPAASALGFTNGDLFLGGTLDGTFATAQNPNIALNGSDGSATFQGTVKVAGGAVQPLIIGDADGSDIDVRERLVAARETFQELQVAVANATDFAGLKAAMLVALEDYQ